MGERYTRDDAEQAFFRLARALGKPFADRSGAVYFPKDHGGYVGGPVGSLWERRNGENVARVGAWHLDYAAAYGGFVVAEIANEGGGESRPLGHRRLNAREFCEAVRFALDALEVRARTETAV